MRSEHEANRALAEGRVIPSWQKPATIRVCPSAWQRFLRYTKTLFSSLTKG